VQVESQHLSALQEQRTTISDPQVLIGTGYSFLAHALSLSLLLALALASSLSPKLYLSPIVVVGVEGAIRI
jgi:hypothetical protein